MSDSFVEAFKQLTGANQSPFPWQVRLYQRLLAFVPGKNEMPRRLDIPTGLGKTSILPIWLLARQVNPLLPRRLVYVVNRRTIVDQATAIAKKLKDNWKGETLHVSTLRGQLEDNRDWQRDPAAQAIIIGTVDLIGSRLLFNAYRGSRWHKSFEAGLMGQDALLIHDEAHLTEPFDALLDRIVELQTREPDERRLRILSLSATKSPSNKKEDIFTLEKEDRDDEAVRRRIKAVKRLTLEELAPKKKLTDRLAELASAYKDTCVRVLVFVRSPADAMAVAAAIKKSLEQKNADDRVAVLTGTIRGYERDKLVEKPVFKHFIERIVPEGGAVFLVCTSAGEIGVDFDADHVVCDLSPLDSMIQRLGRVNRRGEREDTQIQVVVEFKSKARRFDEQRKFTQALLDSLPKDERGQDVSPQSLRTLIDHEDYKDALTPTPPIVELQSMTLDAWSLTSIAEDWPLAVEVEPYLHGIREKEDHRTEVAWRQELDWMEGAADEDVGLDLLFENYPLKPREVLSDRTDHVRDLLLKIKEVRIKQGLPAGRVVVLGKKADFLDLAKNDEQSLFRGIVNRTIVIPASYGGHDPNSGMIDASQAGVEAIDVADKTDAEFDLERFRVLLQRDEETDEWLPISVLPDDFSGPGNRPGPWKQWVKDFVIQNRCRCVHQVKVPSSDSDGDEVSKVILSFEVLPKIAKTKNFQPRLDKHNQDVGNAVRDVCDVLKMDKEIAAPAILAGANHDVGKGCDLWQQAIYNRDRDPDYAKSSKRGMKWQTLEGYRHEFGSLIRLIELDTFKKLTDLEKDLCLHLVAAHHGRGRPYFPAGARNPDSLDAPDDLLSAINIANRFSRLQRKYGHWGLAWLEALIVCADREASQYADGSQS